jgi:hypothetical protein
MTMMVLLMMVNEVNNTNAMAKPQGDHTAIQENAVGDD